MDMENGPDGFSEFYVATYLRLVGSLTLIGGSRTDAEDAVQEAMVRAADRWRKLSRYDDPAAWVRRVALNLLRNNHRSSTRRRAAQARLLAPEAHLDPDPASGTLRDQIADLSLEQRQVIVLHYVYGLSVEQIANELSVRPGTVKSRLSRARSTLRVDIEQGAQDHV